MTRCNRSEVNLKSTVYNQNGQNYFEQLTAYNSMNSHLRRILLAKCVVDARNKSYIRRKKQLCKDIDCKPVCAKTEITDDVIDRLAYDSLHHPADILRMTYSSKYLCQHENQKYFTDCYNYDVICSRSRLRDHVISPSSPLFKSNKFPPLISTNENIKQHSFTEPKPVNTKSAIKIQDTSEHRFGDNSIVYETASEFITQEVNHFSSTESSSSYENSESTQESANMTSDPKNYVKGEEAMYAKFIYEITREIMHKGLYTDKELQEVFDKHLEKNKKILDKNKMLYEIYQLKLNLNVADISDDEEMEELIQAQQLSDTTKVRPPTPPKILNENKVLDKLRLYRSNIIRKAEPGCKKSVVLIDANPELIITEIDVLASLLEANIDPNQAHKICKELLYKSKDQIPMYSPTQSNDNSSMRVPPKSSLHKSNKKYKVNEQEKNCSTDDLITQTNKNIQTE